MNSTDEHTAFSSVPRRLKWLVVVAGIAILLPFVFAFWIHNHRDAHFHQLIQWHVDGQGASHDAMLSIDELLWMRELRAPAEAAGDGGWRPEDSSLYSRVLYYIDRIPTPPESVSLPANDTIRRRLDGILTRGNQIASASPADSKTMLLALREVLNQLRLLHWQEYESQLLAHTRSQSRELSILVPVTLCIVLVGLGMCFGILRSIRSQLERERSLVETVTASEARYRHLLEQLPYGVEEFDRDGTITYSNPAHHRMLGYDPGELEGCQVSTLLADKAERMQHRDDLNKLIHDQPAPQRYVSRNRAKSGEEISVWVDWDYQRDADEEITGFIAIITNITESEAATKALAENEDKYRSLVESTHDWIWEMGVDGRHTFSNHVVDQILGYSKQEVADLGLAELFHPDDLAEVQERLPKLIASKQGWKNWVVRMRHKEGGYRNLESSASPILDADMTVVGYRGIDRDITERILLESQLLNSLREKETLLQEIHHRVKNNLQVISSLLHFQKKKAEGAHEQELLSEAQTRLKAMTLIHEQLYHAKDLSQIELADYLEKLAQQIKAPYDCSENPIALRVEAEPAQLRVDQALPVGMIVTELVTNALKHGYPDDRERRITITLCAEESRIRVTVNDDGVGLPAAIDPDATDSFGMNLVKNLAAQLGGSVRFARDAGTTATLEFPTTISGHGDSINANGTVSRSPRSPNVTDVLQTAT